ncbi:MAG: RNase adapter RapZ [bacterium]
MRLVVVTGLSGAGKSHALKYLEDMGYFCVDNLPTTLIPKFVEVAAQANISKVALGIDVREGDFFGGLFNYLQDVENLNLDYSILFLEASDDVLIRRFSETRRKHPLSTTDTSILDNISTERGILSEIRARADKIIDTSNLTIHQFKEQIFETYAIDSEEAEMIVTILSFGYKYGVPVDADIVMDVRFLPNPYYVDELKFRTGNDRDVREFVMGFCQTREFLERFSDLMRALIPQYKNEGKSYLTIAIGCTGGRHRSVVLANELKSSLDGIANIRVRHRDIDKGGG